ncbi:MAG TPA: hypothetical protein HPQ04_01255 [Rhodospirillaceae bacterium]|nr:hypothetical protein [Rhodospirillaceae bacterium]
MRKTSLLIIVLSVLAGALGLALFNRPPPPASPDAATEQAAREEAAALAASGGIAWRDGPTLNLRLKGGEVLTLADRGDCGDLPCPAGLERRYRYLGWNSAGGGYRLADAAGGELLLPWSDEPPVLTDPRHAASAEQPLPPPPTPAAEADPDLADWLQEIADGRDRSEAPRIAASDGRVRRDGAQLTLTLNDGRKLRLADDLICGQAACPPQIARSFDFAGASPDGRFLVVEEHWDEANAALLVDGRSGAATVLLGLPKFSPDGRRAAATVSDLEWSSPRRLEIWSLAGASPVLDFAVAAKDEDDTVYEALSWTDTDHLLLRRGPWTGPAKSEVMLTHDEGGWHLQTADAGN